MRRILHLLCLALLMSAPSQTGAQGTGSSSPDEVQRFLAAVGAAPSLDAASRRVTAARERLDSAGRLADPEVEGMASRMNGPMAERGSMYEVNVRQPLPKRGERAADRERARAVVALAEADYAVIAGELAVDVATSLAIAEAAEARTKLLQTQLARLENVLRTVETRLAAGGSVRIAERLTVQTRVAAMQLSIEQERKNAADALSEVRGRLGLPPEAPLPGYAAPAASEASLSNAAALQVAHARTDEAVAMAKMARASARPMTAVGLRFERERTGMGDEDTLGIAFMSEIPWRGARYARAEARAADSERLAALADANAVRHRIASTLGRVERAERLAESARKLGNEARARIDAEFDAFTRGAGVAGSGESTVLQSFELLQRTTETELQILDADLAARSARAELWRYLPADRFPTSPGRLHP